MYFDAVKEAVEKIGPQGLCLDIGDGSLCAMMAAGESTMMLFT